MNKAILLALFVAVVTVCDAKVVIPLPRDEASDKYIDQVRNAFISVTHFQHILESKFVNRRVFNVSVKSYWT